MSLLKVNSLRVMIGQYAVLHDVSFSVPEGGVFVLLGRNGAGKTTTLRTLMGLWKAQPGAVMFRGKDISSRHCADIARLGIAYVPENMGIFGSLTVEENMRLATRNRGFDDSRLRRVFALFPALERLWKMRAGLLSGGQKQMLSVARAIIEPRDLILVDEPTKGLAPTVVQDIQKTFAEISRHTTILLVEQNFAFAAALGRHLAVIEDGISVHQGRMADFVADESLRHKLLGLSA